MNLFDPKEVDAVARGTSATKPHRISDLAARGIVDAEASDDETATRISELESKLTREREAHAASIDRLRREMGKREKRAKTDADGRELAAVLASLTDDDLAAMDEDDLNELVQLLKAVDDL